MNSVDAGIGISLEHHGQSFRVTNISVKMNGATFEKIDLRLKQGLLAMGYDIAGQARQRAPWVTGALKNSIRVDDSKLDAGEVEVIAGGGTYAGSDGFSKYIGYAYKREIGPNRFSMTEHYMENGARDILEAQGGEYAKRRYFSI